MTDANKKPLILTKDQEKTLHGFINEGYPHETCGLFIGQSTEAGWTVSEVSQAANLNTERAEDRFQLDPKDFMKTDNRARELKQEIIGIWHSRTCGKVFQNSCEKIKELC